MTKNWDEFLEELQKKLVEAGYRKYSQNLNNCDFSYYKSFDNKKYQIGVLIYDWRKYDSYSRSAAISWSYECMPIGIDSRIDLIASNDSITVEKFEEMSEHFYESMKKYFKYD